MSSRAKNFRRHTPDTDPNSEETKPSPKPPKPDSTQTCTRLSFVDEEGEDIEDTPFGSTGSRRPVKTNPVSSNSTHKLSFTKDRPKAKGLSYSSSSSDQLTINAMKTINSTPNLVPVPHQQPYAEVMSFAQQAEVAIRSVRENITKLNETHKLSLSSLVRTETFVSEALLEISSLEKSLELDEKKYVYMQQLKEYVSVLCDFLNDKAFYIEELEEKMQKLHEKRASTVSDRWAGDSSDKSSEMDPVVRSTMKVLEGSSLEGELRMDKSESENNVYKSSHDELLRTANMLFSDASEEYANLKYVKDRFHGWKKGYGDAYRDSYASLSVPAVFAPYVRFELLKWDPLYDTIDFADMDWHEELFLYSRQNLDSEDEDNCDSNLIPELVEKIALPILHHEIEHCWDVFSTRETKNAVFAVKMVIKYLSLSSMALHELLAKVAVRLTEAVNTLDVPLWGPNVIKDVRVADDLCVCLFGNLIRFLRNICLWKNILAESVTEKMVIDALLRAKMLPHVKCMGLDLHDAVLRADLL